MYILNDISRKIDRVLNEMVLPKNPATLYVPIRYTLDAGGKRIRPLLVLGGFTLFSDDLEKAFPVAAAIEIFHNFTLLHDDLMDRSVLRRGRQTVHRKWNDNTAILSGDAMLIHAYELISGLMPEKLPQILPVLNRVFAGVCEGQQYDMDFENRTDVTTDEYLHMIGLKTAVLMGGALQAGALLGGGDVAAAGLLYEAGMHLGAAFQVQDDLLDTYGEATVWGKTPGDDIADNKKTFLLIKALELADDDDKKRLLELISTEQSGREEKIKAVCEIYHRTGVKVLAEALVEDYFARANELIDAVPVEDSRKKLLREVARTLVGRKK